MKRGPFLTTAAQQEQTIGAEITFSGVGLHSGAQAAMRLIPAPAGSGIVFRRTDLENYEIPATGRNVAKVSYATSLMRGSVLISTTEHLLSALIGYGVDNVIIEIDNLELPILDGSALPYVQAFEAVGLVRQRRRREVLRILREIEVRDGSKFIGVYPGRGYGIHYSIDFPQPIGSATFVGDLEEGDYARLIAPARTFGFKEDEPMLRNMGLIRGVSDACAIIVGAGGVQNGPLRFPRRVRAAQSPRSYRRTSPSPGRRIQGRVVAERAGHAMHVALVQRLLRDRSAWELTHVHDDHGTSLALQAVEAPCRMIAAIALGSNLHSPWGDPAATIAEAVRRLSALGTVTALSTLRSTEPEGFLDQPKFLNGALLLDTQLAPLALLQALLAIERDMGRTREGVTAKGPRLIDLDLLLYDGNVLSTTTLSLPHPAMHTRIFVLEPLAEIAPSLLHPVFNQTVAQLLLELQARSDRNV